METLQPQDPDFEARVRSSFARQTLMKTIGACLIRVSPGEVEIELPFRDDLSQQHGFLHAGIVTALADTACGYAALSLMPVDAAVLTVEFTPIRNNNRARNWNNGHPEAIRCDSTRTSFGTVEGPRGTGST